MQIFIISFLFFFGWNVQAQEVIDIIKSVELTSEDAASAKQQLMDRAMQDASIESIQGMIGEEKTERSKTLIENKIIKQSGKYILSVQGLNFTKSGSLFAMDVQMKISLVGLRSLLLENGLLYQMEGPPKILPVIQVTDRLSGSSYGWWFQSAAKDKSYLLQHSELMHKSLREELQKIGFFSMLPIQGRYDQSVPESYRGENLQRADYLFLGEFFKSSVVVTGNILYRLKSTSENIYVIEVKLEALHTGNGRLMAEVVRSYQTDAGAPRLVIQKKFLEIAPKLAEDLSSQLSDAWKKGTFGASIVRLSVQGKISPLELEEFKKNVVLQVKDIKSMRERLIESGRTIFEVDSSSLPGQLAQVFRSTLFTKFSVEVDGISKEELALKVNAK